MLFAPPYKIFSLMQTIAQKKFGLALQRRYLYANLLYINAYVKGFLLNSPDHSKLCRLLAKKVDGLLTSVYIILARGKGGERAMSLEEKVRQLREKRGMNQKQLAEASDITQATISRIESGQVKELKSQALKRLASALGVTVDYLVDKTPRLTLNDLVQSDPTARYILQGYEKLSAAGREQLRNFVRFLEEQEAKPERRRR